MKRGNGPDVVDLILLGAESKSGAHYPTVSCDIETRREAVGFEGTMPLRIKCHATTSMLGSRHKQEDR